MLYNFGMFPGSMKKVFAVQSDSDPEFWKDDPIMTPWVKKILESANITAIGNYVAEKLYEELGPLSDEERELAILKLEDHIPHLIEAVKQYRNLTETISQYRKNKEILNKTVDTKEKEKSSSDLETRIEKLEQMMEILVTRLNDIL